MKNPKIFFKYSGIFDQVLYHFSTGENTDADDPRFKERSEFVKRKIEEIEKWWNLKGDLILSKISKTTKIGWKQKGIKIYLLAEPHRDVGIGGFSDPITIFTRKRGGKEKELISIRNTIVHELVHQNICLKEDYNEYVLHIEKKYKCDRACAAHIAVYAVLKRVLSKKELIFELKRKHPPAYEKALKITKREGSKKILKELNQFKEKT
jgi:hypothetical protein